MKVVVARWETKGNDWLELHRDASGYTYAGRDCGGVLPSMASDAEAIAWMERDWGRGAGPVTVLRSDRRSLRRVV